MIGVAALLIVVMAGGSIQQPTVDEVVRQFVPYEKLGLDRADPADPAETCAAVLETDRSGQPTLIAAAYLGRRRGRLLILERQDDGRFTLLAEEDIDGNDGPCEAEVPDFDGDGRPEIFVTVSGMRGPHVEGFIFRWTDAVAMASPAHRLVPVESGLHDPELIDVLHDGTTQIFQASIDYGVPVEGPRTGHVIVGGRADGSALRNHEESWVVCDRSSCDDDPARLQDVDPGRRYTLRLVNGDRGGANRVRVIGVTVNGRERLPKAARPSDGEFIEVPLGAGLKPGTAVHVRATPTGSAGKLVAVLIRQP
jgi:FG-GAP-like repeat